MFLPWLLSFKKIMPKASSQENAATLLIRMTVEILGPQEDEKSGCPEEWFVFCEKKEVKCRFTSFRGNRFNNLFDNSSALIFHKHHIPDFSENFASNGNLKLQSILLGLKDKKIVSITCAMAFVNNLLTSPYWKLMHEKIKRHVSYL